MIVIKLTNEQYDLIELALGLSMTFLWKQISYFGEVESYKFPMIKEMDSMYYDIGDLHRDFESGCIKVKEEE